MKKRGKGISPLIATVLLIGFTVIIAVSVWMWYGDIVRGQFMKQGALSDIEQSCMSDIFLEVPSASKSGSDVTVTIRNSGNKIFNGVRVLVNDGEQVLSEKESFSPSEEKTITVTASVSADSIEVMPMIVRQGVPGTCSEKGVKYKL
ncbi:hypothetical protein J4427_01840 [Candidatus Woesearchaeota archaeon]|nr:hypothetical protein [Candidatus Woesearchaeota archaeon]